MRAEIIGAIALVASCAVTAPASAQDGTQTASPVALDLRAVHASIDSESAAATGLYIGAVIAHLGGLVAAPMVFMMSFVACSMEDPPSCAQGWEYGALAASIVSGLGAVALGLAIGLDVDSGVRRRRLARRATDAEVSLRIGPTSAALVGRF